jgi:hypothetical protein
VYYVDLNFTVLLSTLQSHTYHYQKNIWILELILVSQKS